MHESLFACKVRLKFNYQQTIQQAQNLEQMASDLSGKTKGKLTGVKDNLNAAWTGNSGKAFIKFIADAELDNIYNSMQKQIKTLDETISSVKKVWTGDAANTYLKQYEKNSNSFKNMAKDLDNYISQVNQIISKLGNDELLVSVREDLKKFGQQLEEEKTIFNLAGQILADIVQSYTGAEKKSVQKVDKAKAHNRDFYKRPVAVASAGSATATASAAGAGAAAASATSYTSTTVNYSTTVNSAPTDFGSGTDSRDSTGRSSTTDRVGEYQ